MVFNRTVFDSDRVLAGQLGRLSIEATVVHELAHVWDVRNHGRLSTGMYAATHYAGENGEIRDRGFPASNYGYSNNGRYDYREDWAEEVAAFVFHDTGIASQYPYFRGDSSRTKYLQGLFANSPDF